MTTHAMTCTSFENALGAYLEGDLDPAERAAAERHRRGCASCAALAADLERIAADAAALPVRAPERDLWAGIEPRIATPVADLTGRGAARTELLRAAPRRWRSWPLAAAAAALVAVTAGVTYEVTAGALRGETAGAVAGVASPAPRGAPGAAAGDETTGAARRAEQAAVAARPGAPDTATRPAPGSRGEGAVRGAATLAARRPRPGQRAALAMLPEEAVFDEEIAVLRAALRERRAELDSGTVALLERNIGVIDAAIRQSREALARDPRSPFLGDQLSRALDHKVRLLRTAAALPART